MTQLQTGVSYFGNRWPAHFARDLDDMLAHGCTYVVHTFSEDDLLFAQRTMAGFFRATRDAGLGCWADPWGVLGLFGGEAFSAFAPRHPDDCQILSTGQRAPAACPSAPATRQAMRTWIDAALDAGADTIFWDEPHLFLVDWEELQSIPRGAWACRCARCLDGYQQRFGSAMPLELTPEVRAFRHDLLLDFLGEMTAYVQARGARNAVCVMPVADHASEGLPWDRVSALPGVDVFGTDPYWYFARREAGEFVAEQTRRVLDACRPRGVEPHIWVQAFNVPEGREGEIELALRTAAGEGATVLAAWGFRGCEALSRISSARPDVVWETIGRTYRALHAAQAAAAYPPDLATRLQQIDKQAALQ